jgi:ubiquinol-cytochrome c reductase cytochrome c subunit
VWIVVALALAGPAGAHGMSAKARHGKMLFGQYCVACHGANGVGIGGSGRSVGGGPGRLQDLQKVRGPSLRGVGKLAADFYLRTGYMPLREAGQQPRRSRVFFGERDLDALVAYVGSLGGGPGTPHPRPQRGSLSTGLHLFTEHCAGCHQVVGRGGYATGAYVPPLDRATSRQIAEAVRIGPYLMPRFSERAISNRELDSIVRYVRYARHPDNRGGLSLGDVGPVPEGLVTWLVAAAALVGMCVLLAKRLSS